MNRDFSNINYNKFVLPTIKDAYDWMSRKIRTITKESISPANSLVMRFEVPVGKINILKWLNAQQSQTRFYFSGRDAADLEVAGVGIADSIYLKESLDIPLAFKHMNQFLNQDHPHLKYYGGFSFAPGHIDEEWESFGACHLFVPRFELFSKDGQTNFACNLIFNQADGKKSDNFERIENTILDLKKLNPNIEDFQKKSRKLISSVDTPTYLQWLKNLSQVITEIKAQKYSKVVLARKVKLQFDYPLESVAILDALKQLPTLRYDFLFQFNSKKIFLGSSPERLYKREGNIIKSEAVAGTRSRGKLEQEDDQLAMELMESDKDKREHDFVLKTLERELKPLCNSFHVENKKGLLKLKEGQHLISHLEGVLKEHVTDDLLISRLHPTPAIGGCPTQKALQVIKKIEPFCRGWYAGIVGNIGYQSCDMAVALRSGLINENQLNLYSGVGIVEGSNPVDEWQEVNVKISNLLDIVNHESI